MKHVYFLTILVACIHTHIEAYRIAILYQTQCPSIERLIQGFTETICYLNPEMVLYNGNNNSITMQQNVELTVQQNYDLIFALGSKLSKYIYDICQQQACTTPLILSVPNLNEADFTKILQLPNSCATAVTTRENYPEALNTLKCFNNIKKALILHSPSEYNRKTFTQLQALLREKHAIDTLGIEITSIQDDRFKHYIAGRDIVFILKDPLLLSHAEALSHICNQMNVPVFAFDLSAAGKGALFCYGFDFRQIGIEAGKKARAILVEKKIPAQLPLSVISNTLAVNGDIGKKYIEMLTPAALVELNINAYS